MRSSLPTKWVCQPGGWHSFASGCCFHSFVPAPVFLYMCVLCGGCRVHCVYCTHILYMMVRVCMGSEMTWRDCTAVVPHGLPVAVAVEGSGVPCDFLCFGYAAPLGLLITLLCSASNSAFRSGKLILSAVALTPRQAALASVKRWQLCCSSYARTESTLNAIEGVTVPFGHGCRLHA